MTRSAADIRREFLEFFRSRGHEIVPGSPVVPYDDPTLLFTNAGMNQFKDVFLGVGSRPYTRAADTQACIRAGGKHNDLDDVGHDTYHHTLFEMLGNWSFGDYFKREAIQWAWELLTEVWGLDKRRLYATYFGGLRNGAAASEWELEPDHEARDLWLEVTDIDPSHVVAGDMKDNFWEMGDTGPCGPCSEIHIDLTPDRSGGPLVNAGDHRVIEIWNLVFIQFNRGTDGVLTPLPAKHVDTGMGFERITAVIQGIARGRLGEITNYDTDVFTPIFAAIQEITGAEPYEGRLESPGGEPSDRTKGDLQRAALMRDVSYRVIADHIRALSFAIADGALPDKIGRGYVLRRILRRAVRYGWQYLDQHEPFLHRLVATVADNMGDAFPQLRAKAEHIAEVVREEETSFARTLERGIALFEQAAAAAREHHGEIAGADAFKLHDTYGFPIDLTQIMAAEKGLRVDIGEYERLMEEAREKARGAKRDLDDVFDVRTERHACDDTLKYVAPYECQAIITSYAKMRGRRGRDPATKGDRVTFTTNRTPFYAEQGGQVSDRGIVRTSNGNNEIRVDEVHKIGETVIHVGTVTKGEINSGEEVRMIVDRDRRIPTMKNHTATHILNWALRETLGEHVDQKGSLVDPEKTRFDFSNPKPVAPEQIAEIERLCAEQIAADHPVYAGEADQAAARGINGLRAVFGEKYPDRVRVVSIGVPVADLLANPDNPEWRRFSIEFCGGTHVHSTGEIEDFVIVSEEAVAKGVRRVVGVTGEKARRAVETGRAIVTELKALLASAPENLAAELARLRERLSDSQIRVTDRHQAFELLERLADAAKKQRAAQASAAADVAIQAAEKLLVGATKHPCGGSETTIIVGEMPNVPADQLKSAADFLKQKCGSAVVLFGVRAGEKAVLLASMSPDLIKAGLKAGDLVKHAAKLVKGGGGGPPTMAQAGGKDPSKIPDALAAGREWIEEKLSRA